MARIRGPHWIKHSHLFDPDEYECSVCGRQYALATQTCPGCGAVMQDTDDPQDWVDEMEMLDIILEDD